MPAGPNGTIPGFNDTIARVLVILRLRLALALQSGFESWLAAIPYARRRVKSIIAPEEQMSR